MLVHTEIRRAPFIGAVLVLRSWAPLLAACREPPEQHRQGHGDEQDHSARHDPADHAVVVAQELEELLHNSPLCPL